MNANKSLFLVAEVDRLRFLARGLGVLTRVLRVVLRCSRVLNGATDAPRIIKLRV